MSTDTTSETDAPEGEVLWVRTLPTDHGYDVILDAGEKRSRKLDPRGARRYAAGVLTTVARADHDAAIAHQLRANLSEGRTEDETLELVGHVLANMRADRPDVPPAATWPVRLTAGVNRDFEPFILVRLAGDDEPSGQWTLDAARGHAMGVLEATAVADLDAAYRRTLRSAIGLDAHVAGNMVEDLDRHRWGGDAR